MIQAVIIDDEKHCIQALGDLLVESHIGDVEVLATYTALEEAFTGIKKLRPQLLFLDISVQGKHSFDLLKQLQANRINGFNVIFTTAYNQYAVEAFKCSAIHYLLKPIDGDDLAEAIARVKEDMKEVLLLEKLELFGQQIGYIKKDLSKVNHETKILSIHTTDEKHFKPINSIVRFQSFNKKIRIFLMHNEMYEQSNTSLNYYESLLSEYRFYRTSENSLINVEQIDKYSNKDGMVKMKDGTEIAVSEARKKGFKNYVDGLM